MKLEFNLLMIDDNPQYMDGSIGILRDYLDSVGFSLNVTNVQVVSEGEIRKVMRDNGRDFDLVIVDFNLGNPAYNGANAAQRLRRGLNYTDILFYSSDKSSDLFEALMRQKVSGVFIANRNNDISDDLKGIAETIIGKAIDLNHMRGIAMSEVADMDVQMEEVLLKVFTSGIKEFDVKAKETLEKIIEHEEKRVVELKNLIAEERLIEVITNTGFFSSANRCQAIGRVCKVLGNRKPKDEAETFKRFIDEVLVKGRNVLAHARAEKDDDGNTRLRSSTRGHEAIIIDDVWMRSFRSLLREHKAALFTICAALSKFTDEAGAEI